MHVRTFCRRGYLLRLLFVILPGGKGVLPITNSMSKALPVSWSWHLHCMVPLFGVRSCTFLVSRLPCGDSHRSLNTSPNGPPRAPQIQSTANQVDPNYSLGGIGRRKFIPNCRKQPVVPLARFCTFWSHSDCWPVGLLCILPLPRQLLNKFRHE